MDIIIVTFYKNLHNYPFIIYLITTQLYGQNKHIYSYLFHELFL